MTKMEVVTKSPTWTCSNGDMSVCLYVSLSVCLHTYAHISYHKYTLLHLISEITASCILFYFSE